MSLFALIKSRRNSLKVNKTYKSSVFSLLFSDPDVLRELYCALKGVTLQDDIPIVINTLEDVLFMDKVNDISFEIGGKLVVLIDHQSTINPNMALRLLMYIARVYEKIIDDRSIYSTKKISIPQPEFFVLYNGIDSYPDKEVLKLSDSFKNMEDLGLEKTSPVLELIVTVFNINQGKNEAIKKAVIYCRNHDILKEPLEEQGSEVLNMLMTEWNLDDAKQVWYEEGREEGHVEGHEEGFKKRDNELIDNARKALADGIPIEHIQKITGFDLETIKGS